MSFDQLTYRKTMGFFATGVAVLTLPDEDEFKGITLNSLTSVSLDPAIILFCVKRHADSYAKVMASRHYSINILSEDQKDIAIECTKKGGGIIHSNQIENSENLKLKGSLATINCHTFETHVGGDHTIIVARVDSLEAIPSKNPLLFYKSEFTSFSSPLENLKIAI